MAYATTGSRGYGDLMRRLYVPPRTQGGLGAAPEIGADTAAPAAPTGQIGPVAAPLPEPVPTTPLPSPQFPLGWPGQRNMFARGIPGLTPSRPPLNPAFANLIARMRASRTPYPERLNRAGSIMSGAVAQGGNRSADAGAGGLSGQDAVDYIRARSQKRRNYLHRTASTREALADVFTQMLLGGQ